MLLKINTINFSSRFFKGDFEIIFNGSKKEKTPPMRNISHVTFI